MVLLFLDSRYWVYHREVPHSFKHDTSYFKRLIPDKFLKITALGCFLKFVCLCLFPCLLCECVYLELYHCLFSVSRLYYHSMKIKGLRSSTPRSFLLSLSFLNFSPFLSTSLCLVFEPLPVTVNLRQPLCWHRWEVNRNK